MGYETYVEWKAKQQRYKEKVANLRRDSHRAMRETLLRWLALQDQRKVAARERIEKAKQNRIEKERQERFAAAAAATAAAPSGGLSAAVGERSPTATPNEIPRTGGLWPQSSHGAWLRV